jgi:hypothetical protein
VEYDTAADIARGPRVSVVVVVYNIPREAPRTLLSLSADYQQHIHADDLEVVVVDNGSTPPFDPSVLATLKGTFRLIRLDPAAASPAKAINRGIAEATGDVVGVLIDGARIATPGLLNFSRRAASLYNRTVVATLGWYLGADFQRHAMAAGYTAAREDELLTMIGWPRDGYRLFEIGTLDESSVDGWLMPITESNALFMRAELWAELGGFDERFDLPGGGLVNLDTFGRALDLPGAGLVTLLGEGTFHQLHGGVATNAPVEALNGKWAEWAAQYQAIRGKPYAVPAIARRTFLGTLPRPVLTRFVRAAVAPVWQGDPAVEPPLGRGFDLGRWRLAPSAAPQDPQTAAAVDLAMAAFRSGETETAAELARLIRAYAPDEPEPQRLLSLVGACLEGGGAVGRETKRLEHLFEAERALTARETVRLETLFAAERAANERETVRLARVLQGERQATAAETARVAQLIVYERSLHEAEALRLQQLLADERRRHETTSGQLAAVHTSGSWRLTRPLREAARLAAAVKRELGRSGPRGTMSAVVRWASRHWRS